MMHLGIELIGFPRGWQRPIPFALEVYSFQPDCFYINSRQEEKDFSMDIIDLAYATARTLCSYHLDKKELYFDIIASLLSHLNFVDASNGRLLLSESRYNRLRDFSKTTRIGEMAQGINALFVSKRLNFPFIIDFDLAKNQILLPLNIQSSGKTPDFVVINDDYTKIGLFESKGTMNGAVSGCSGYLGNAMEQINAVEQPCFDYSIPTCVQFKHNSDEANTPNINNTSSSINYAFIQKECTDQKVLKRLFKLNYASWFYLVGDFNRVTSLLSEGTIENILPENDPIYELDTTTDKGNPIFWVKRPFENVFASRENGIEMYIGIHAFFDTGSDVKIGIYKSVIDNILSSPENSFTIPEGEINYLRKYPDGTLLYIKTK